MGSTDPYAVLASRIRIGFYPPGSRLPAERELAADLSVHRHTVRSAIARLAADGLVTCRPHHRPTVNATVFVSDGWKTVALLMGNEEPFKAFHLVIRGCEPELRAAGYRLVFMDTWAHADDATRERERSALSSLIDHPCAGAILWCQAQDASAPIVEDLIRGGTPIVAIDRHVSNVPLDFVGVDNVLAARKATDHLIQAGHRRIGFVVGEHDNATPVLDRRRGFEQALRSHGLPHGEELVFPVPADRVEDATVTVARRVAQSQDRPTALFVVNDFYAIYLVSALRGVGLRVPEDIAVAGFDDIETQALVQPFLTTVRQPFEEMGRSAARLLLERLRQPSLPLRHILLETSLLVRQSTASMTGALVGASAERPL